MTEEQIRQLGILAQKEDLLASIIIWLKTKNLYNECMSVINPKLVESED